MQAGTVTPETLPAALRSISQRRQQGVLEIRLVDGEIKIYFVAGRIVELSVGASSPVQDLKNRIVSAGLLKEGAEQVLDKYEALFRELHTSGPDTIDIESYKRMIKHRLLDKLYSLDLNNGGMFAFKIQMVQVEKDFMPSISVGQVLLDLVAYQAEKPTLSKLITEGVHVKLVTEPNYLVSEEERVLLEALTGEITIQELTNKTLLSCYHFQEAFLTLQRNGIIAVVDARKSDLNKESSIDVILDSTSEEINQKSDTPPASVIHGVRSQVSADEEDEEESQSFSLSDFLSFKTRIAILSMKMLEMRWIPDLLLLGFLVASIISLGLYLSHFPSIP